MRKIAMAGALLAGFVLAVSASATAAPVVYGTNFGVGYWHPVVRPRAWYFGVDDVLQIHGIQWSSWHQYSAYGKGTRGYDNCVPRFYLRLPPLITASGREPVTPSGGSRLPRPPGWLRGQRHRTPHGQSHAPRRRPP